MPSAQTPQPVPQFTNTPNPFGNAVASPPAVEMPDFTQPEPEASSMDFPMVANEPALAFEDVDEDDVYSGGWGMGSASKGNAKAILEDVLIDEDVTEIHVTAPDKLFVRVKGQYIKVPEFDAGSDEEYESVLNEVFIEKATKTVKPISNDYLVEAKIAFTYPDGQRSQARLHVLTEPATAVPQVTIAKWSKTPITLDDMVDGGTLSSDMAQFIRDITQEHYTTIISGASGAGKALTHTTTIHTPHGPTTMGDIQPGDTIITSSGVWDVTSKHPQGKRPTFLLTLARGDSYECDAEHNWVVASINNITRKTVKTTQQLIDEGPHNFFIINSGATPATLKPRATLEQVEHYARTITRLTSGQEQSLAQWLPYTDTTIRQAFIENLPEALNPHTPPKLARLVAGSLGMAHLADTDEKGTLIRIQSITPTGREEEVSCITVNSPDNTYLIGDWFTTTHNTTLMMTIGRDEFWDNENIIIVEDLPELDFNKEMQRFLETTPEKPGKNDDRVTMDYLVRQSKRMRPTRIIIGEVRGPEIVSFLDAATSGVNGCMNTIHADSSKDCVQKIVNMATANSGNGTSETRVMQDISKGVRFIIQAIREEGKANNRHLITEIAEVGGVQSGQVAITTIFEFDEKANGGQGAHILRNLPSEEVRRRLTANNRPSAKIFGKVVEARRQALI